MLGENFWGGGEFAEDGAVVVVQADGGEAQPGDFGHVGVDGGAAAAGGVAVVGVVDDGPLRACGADCEL